VGLNDESSHVEQPNLGCQTSVTPFLVALLNNQLVKKMSRIDLRMRKKKNKELNSIGQDLNKKIYGLDF